MHPLTAAVTALGPEWLQPDSILERFGTWAVVAVLVILFVECGLLIFFLPGDSLLFVTGLFVATGAIQTPLWLALLLMSIAAVAGNLVGYWVGRKAGPPLFERPNSRLIKPKHVAQTHEFFEKYGARSIILARFVPIVRTFAPVAAGVGHMPWRRYTLYNFIGAMLWGFGLTMVGYVIAFIPWVRDLVTEYIDVILLIAVGGTAIVTLWHYFRERAKARKEAARGDGETDAEEAEALVLDQDVFLRGPEHGHDAENVDGDRSP